MKESDYVTRVLDTPKQLDAAQWNSLLEHQSHSSPFMRHEYLTALHASESAVPSTGWTLRFLTLWDTSGPDRVETLVAACPIYLKDHSYGEYVFDWAWANAYAQHGLNYYPKALVAVPFTPVPGSRLLARDAAARLALVQSLIRWTQSAQLSSLHLLFGSAQDMVACVDAGMMLRHTVQFHWNNQRPKTPEMVDQATTAKDFRFRSFDDFLSSLSQEKRKKIRHERRKVADAGVSFRWATGQDISTSDWDFFYRCYERTYLEHGNVPYLSRDFFKRMADTMPENWLLFVAQRQGKPIATSLIAIKPSYKRVKDQNHPGETADDAGIAYGRYWGALERVDCLHFEACYYQPLQWCIDQGYQRFEGGAQGEHKMARALLPVKTTSAHWLSHPAFANAVENFLQREGQGINSYLSELNERSPFKQDP
jgi:hypothetical protein